MARDEVSPKPDIPAELSEADCLAQQRRELAESLALLVVREHHRRKRDDAAPSAGDAPLETVRSSVTPRRPQSSALIADL